MSDRVAWHGLGDRHARVGCRRTGFRIGWSAATPGTDVGLKVAAKDVGADLTIIDLPSSVNVCAGGDLWLFPNACAQR